MSCSLGDRGGRSMMSTSGGIESESCGGGSVCDQVHPEQLQDHDSDSQLLWDSVPACGCI